MTNPFPPEGQNPFLTPFQGAAGAGQPGAAPSPFLETGSVKNPRAADLLAGKPLKEAPVNAPREFSSTTPPRPIDFPPPATGGGFASAPAFSASPASAGSSSASARKSQILSISEMDNINKPEFFLTTTTLIDGYSIKEYLGLVSIEIVVPKDLLFRNPAPHGDLHRLKSAEDELQRVKTVALQEISQRARSLGADGVVGMTLQFSQFDAIVCLCSAVGTAVKLA